MNAIEAFIAKGAATDVVLAVVVAELVALLVHWRRGGAPPRRWLSPLVAGAALVLSLRMALVGAPPLWLGLTLSVAGIAHLAGYRERWGI